MLEHHALDVAVERERARRLVDRFGRNESLGGELARECLAHEVSAQFRKELSERPNLGILQEETSLRANGVEKLETALHGRRQSQISDMLAEEELSRQKTKMEEQRVEPAGSRRASKTPAFDGPVGQPLVRRKPASEILKEALDDISVTSILDFRSAGNGNPAAEAVATAATCTIANIDDTVRLDIHSLNPDEPWKDSLSILGKPGHFINSLRKFPSVVDAGRVPETNIVGARHFLAMAQTEENVVMIPAVASLQRWVEQAIRYWERLEAESVPGSACQSTPATARAAQGSSAPSSAERPSGGRDSFQPLPRTSGQAGTRPRSVGRPASKAATSPGASRGSLGSTAAPAPAPSLGTSRRSAASPRPRPERQSGGGPGSQMPSWSTAPAPRVGTRAAGASNSPAPPRSAASPRRQPGTTAGAAARTNPAANSAAVSPGPPRTAASPRSRPGASGRAPATSSSTPSWAATAGVAPASGPRRGASPQATTHRGAGSPASRPSGIAYSQPAAPAVRQAMSPGRRSYPSTGGASGAAQPPARQGASLAAPSTRASPSRPSRATSPRQSPTRSAAALAPGGNAGATNGSASGGGSMSSSRSVGTLATRGNVGNRSGTTLQVASPQAPAPPAVNGVQPGSVQEFRRMLEETKKEVREIRAMESQMKWSMQREERRERMLDEKEAQDEIRDWRWRQSDEMKAFVEEKTQEVKIQDLAESKDFQEFKREAKAQVKEEEKKLNHEEYLKDTENAAWRAELAKVIYENDKVVTAQRQESLKEVKEIKQIEKVQERMEEEANREHDQALEMANQAKQLQKEREQLLQNLEYVRSCQRNMPLQSGQLSTSSRSSGMRQPIPSYRR